MTTDEVDEFLGRHETGVLSLARGDDPYAIPISYGYDPDARQIYLRLVSAPGSEKRQFLSSDPRARVVVYEEQGDTYRSVVGLGSLVEIPREELTVERIEPYGRAKRPLFEIWSETTPDLDVALYEFDPEELSGRRVVIDRES